LPLATCALVAALLVAGCNRDNKPALPAQGPIEVSVATIEARDVPVVAEYIAQTQSSHSVNVQARVSGFLDKRTYVEGSVVKTGQILFEMDKKPFQAQVDAAKAAMQRNQAALDVAKANLARTKPLTEQEALSQKDLDDAQGQYEQAAAAVEQAKAQLSEAELNLSYTTIRSPVAGVSSYAAIAEGTYVNPQNAQLTTVSVLSPMWINFSVSENELERVRDRVRQGVLKLPPGDKLEVAIELVDGTRFPYTGTITFTDPSYNAQTGTFLIRASVDNPDGTLHPNQYVRAKLLGATHPNAILVPQRAVQQGAKGHFVWVVDATNHAEQRPVLVGDWYADSWFVLQGLRVGEHVVVDGGLRLRPGAAVQPKPFVAPNAAPGTVAGATGAPRGGASATPELTVPSRRAPGAADPVNR
jgi:membrane fusion protein (multidrug efflux system)